MYGFGPQFVSEFKSADIPLKNVSQENGSSQEILEFSWQYGVFDNPGSQGWHGLKGKVSNGFFILDQGGHQIYRSQVYVPVTGYYRIEIEGVDPDYLLVDQKPADRNILLEEGWHQCTVAYANTEKGKFRFQKEHIGILEREVLWYFPGIICYPGKTIFI